MDKKRTLIGCTLVVTGLAVSLSVGLAQSIVGSAHDFSGEAWSGGRICAPCHTPHHARSKIVPLWNHRSTRTVFILYSSRTLDANVGQPEGVSKACLSCHDGTVAIDSFGSRSGAHYVSGRADLGADLSDDHPISFVYDSSLAADDGDLHDPTTKSSGLGGTINEDLLVGQRLECSSCHNPHNESGENDLLVRSNSGSALCLTCHDK